MAQEAKTVARRAGWRITNTATGSSAITPRQWCPDHTDTAGHAPQ